MEEVIGHYQILSIKLALQRIMKQKSCFKNDSNFKIHNFHLLQTFLKYHLQGMKLLKFQNLNNYLFYFLLENGFEIETDIKDLVAEKTI